MSEKKIKFKLNVFDIVIIVAVIAIAAILVVPKLLPSENTNTTAQTQNSITYSIELYNLPASTAEKIKVGDKITDKVKKYEIGEVTDVLVVPYKKSVNDLVDGKVVQSVVPDKYKAIVTIKADATETDTAILVGGGYEVRVGASASVVGAGYFGTGYITEVERKAN